MQPVNLEDYRDEYVYGGVDLSAVKDLTCTSICIPPNEYREKYPDKFIFKTWVYIPAIAMEESVNKHLYKEWVKHKQAILTEGNAVDYNLILKDQVDLTDIITFGNIGYDSYNATQYVIQATNAGLPMQPFAQGLGNFNKPTKFLEMLIMTDKVIIDANTAILWSFNNVTLKYDYHENCKPDKPTQEAKIDPVISMTEALGTYLASSGYDAQIV
jgi:phage terminase large subunit-like protein